MRILIFTEGTILIHKNSQGLSREQIIQQVRDGDVSIHDFESYIPIGNAAQRLKQLQSDGHEILYLTSRRRPEEIRAIQNVLDKNGFPEGELNYRRWDETYAHIVEKIMPDILIEDDCESIGGEKEVTFHDMGDEAKRKMRRILVREFGGIDQVEI